MGNEEGWNVKSKEDAGQLAFAMPQWQDALADRL
jgi:hypothetical protein